MQIFINECSLHSQFYTHHEFTEAIKVFYSIFAFINRQKIEKTIFKSADLFVNYRALKDELFSQSLKHSLREKSLARALKNVVFNKQNAADWNSDRQHSENDSFEYNHESVTNTSMAELAERKLKSQHLTSTLVNFQRSKFKGLDGVQIIKNKGDYVHLDCVENQHTLEKWLRKNSLMPHVYDPSSKEPPIDSQTVLRDPTRFRATQLPSQDGRKVYRELKTGYYWYVDNFHFGKAGHLEVFNQNGDHIGEADLEGNINNSKVDRKKKLKI